MSSPARPWMRRLFAVTFAFSATMLPNMVLLVQNRGRIAAPLLLWQVTIASALLAAFLAIMLFRVSDPLKAGVGVGSVGYIFFSLGWVPNDPLWTRLLLFAGIAFLLARLLIWLMSDSTSLLAVGATVLTLSVLTLGAYGSQTADNPSSLALVFEDVEPIRTPNVYLFVLDGMGRPDNLATTFPSIELDESLSQLEQMGFTLSSNSTSNYALTHLSIPSMLNGEYQSTAAAPLPFEEEWSYARRVLRGDNRSVAFFANAGYEYWHATSGIWDHAPCDETIADRCIGAQTGGADELKAALWDSTPFGRHLVGPGEGQDPTTVVSSIVAELDRDLEGPAFTFAHILSPHSPYRFDADCAPIDVATVADGGQPEHKPYFSGQATCLGTQLVEAMSQLIEADPTAIILIQADHGPGFDIDWGYPTWTPEMQQQRFSTFRAFRGPDDCLDPSARAQTVVNTSRVLESCITGEHVELLERAHFISSGAGLQRLDEQEANELVG